MFGGGLLVGTTSYGDTGDCRGSSHLVRVDDNLRIINAFVNLSSGGPAPADPQAPGGF